MPTDPQQVYNLFFHAGEVVEIRAIGLRGKSPIWEGWSAGGGVLGYFDNAADFGKAARELDRLNHDGIYFTLNPPDPAVLARAKNKLVAATKQRPATSDNNIRCIRWLYVDIDSQPLSGISSTEEELMAAYELAKRVALWLTREHGFPKPVGGMSGNGYHLNYRLPDLPNEAATSSRDGLIYRCLAVLAAEFNQPRPAPHVDQGVFNAARICKVYGTMARKGDNVSERPHRASFLFDSAPKELAGVAIVSKETIEKLAAVAAAPPAAAASSSAPMGTKLPVAAGGSAQKKPAGKTKKMPKEYGNLGKLDVVAYLEKYRIGLHSTEQKGGETYYILDHCVFDSSHQAKDAAIKQGDDGTLRYTCFHDSCQGRTWKEARTIISGGDSIMELHENYDPDFKGARQHSPGSCLLKDLEIISTCTIGGNADIVSPEEINASEFFEFRGTREVFVPMRMAKYLAYYLKPIVCTAGVFWRYENGVWKTMSDGQIRNVAIKALGDVAQTNYIENAVSLMGNMINQEEDAWPSYVNMINVGNGVIDLDGIGPENEKDIDIEDLLKPHDPKYGMRTQLAANFDPAAEYNEWIRTLWSIFPEGRNNGRKCAGDEKMYLLQQYYGYVLMPTTEYHKCIFFIGPGSNGKSTLIDALINVVGKKNHLELSIDELAKSFNIPYLQGKMLITAAEMSSREAIGIQTLKKCISGDEVSGEKKFGERVQFRNRAKFIFAMNNTPTINDRSYGFERRVLSLTFNRRFEESEMDHYLYEKLAAERDGIFLWMLQGAIDLKTQRGFTESDAVLAEKRETMQRLNSLLMYISERIDQDPQYKTPAMEVYKDYQSWCGESGLQALGRPKFYEQLSSALPHVRKERTFVETGGRPYCLTGIELKLKQGE